VNPHWCRILVSERTASPDEGDRSSLIVAWLDGPDKAHVHDGLCYVGRLPAMTYVLDDDKNQLRRVTPQETLAARARWKPTFTEWLQNQSHNELRTDVIIRDIKRMDNYPDVDERSKGITEVDGGGIPCSAECHSANMSRFA
jgi:hypothetical protein